MAGAQDAGNEPLRAVLENTQIPHQPLMLISDSSTCSGLPIFRDSLRRALRTQSPVLLISVLHPPSHLLPADYPSSTQIIDLTDSIPGFSDDSEWTSVSARVLAVCKTLGAGAQIFVDAADTLAEDHGIAPVGKLIRSLLKHVKDTKAPARLSILLGHQSPLFAQLISPTFSATVVSIHPHHPSTIAHLSKQYLAPVAASHQFWQILENARLRGTGDALVYAGEGSLGDWSAPRVHKPSSAAGSSKSQGVVVQVLVRKATGGTKGISRSLEGLAVAEEDSSPARSAATSRPALQVVPLSHLVALQPVSSAPTGSAHQLAALPSGGQQSSNAPASAHADLLLPFNLTLTDEQKRRRGEVPVPYAHEGEGVELGFDDEEDEDDEEI